jgi:hypothetical protein
LGGGGEGEERHVRLPPAGGDLLGETVLHRVGHLVHEGGLGSFRQRELRRFGLNGVGAAAQHLLHLLGGVAGLGGVGLVDDDRVAAGPELLDVTHHERELLDRGDDDAGPLAG